MNPPTDPAAAPTAEDRYDAVVIGGAVAGAGAAMLLRRFHPRARVLVVEPQERFPRKVGEATVEVSGYYLEQVLEQQANLAAAHLPKHGLRFWFGDGEAVGLDEMTEVGARDQAGVPSFQLDRARLDEGVLASAVAAGCELARPARVTAWEEGWPQSRLTLETAGGERRVSCRWLIDASGRQAFIARRKRLLDRVEEHPTAAAWSRWEGVVDLDDPDFLAAGDRRRLPQAGNARRRLATNHFCGYGWWCWMIPLADGATSVGLVYNKELFEPPGDGGLEQRYREMVTSRPGLAELMAGASRRRGRLPRLPPPALRQPPLHGPRLGAGRRCRRLPRPVLQPGPRPRGDERLRHRPAGGGGPRRRRSTRRSSNAASASTTRASPAPTGAGCAPSTTASTSCSATPS